MRFSDGGTDQRNTLESVKCATIALFKNLNCDMIILGMCAPGHSWVNPAERVMSILNLGLQNCSTERDRLDDKTEAILKKTNSMAGIRQLAQAEENYDLKKKWGTSVKSVKESINAQNVNPKRGTS